MRSGDLLNRLMVMTTEEIECREKHELSSDLGNIQTEYQLYADKESGRLEKATDFLLIPEYLMYKLTGTKSHEYTNATTTGLVDTITALYSQLIINELDLPKRLFQPLQKPGTVVGEYKGIKVVLCATHDTGSAVEGIPVTDNVPYISSGTWSLLGVKSHEAIHDSSSRETNWSNEGGVGYIRYQKNIMGMWLVNRLRDELCPGKDWQMIIAEAATSQYSELVDANGQVFLSPTSMRAAFDSELQTLPSAPGDYFRCAYRSLAFSYAQAIRELETNTGKEYSALYLVGGGAKNAFLNQLIEEATGMQVIALPIEATAIGNLKVQMEVEK